ncbi:MAG TPA: hypothetical protein VFT08_04915 [Pyrinomonadaceae bacterium]|nr:hypothetical protein [Pyrinomonadaceae bacterium]
MKLKISFAAVLFCSLPLVVQAQEPVGARPKRARTPDDYKAGTLKDLAAKAASAESRGNKEETMVVDSDLSPTRVRAKYAGLTAKTPQDKAELIRQWARLYAGSLDTYKPYEVDVAFTEDGQQYWLTFRQKTLTDFWNSGWNKPVDLFLIRMGAVKQGDKWVPVLLVESFEEVK